MSTAFILSGGGSLGAVQVGMLQSLAETGVRPDLLVGTSAGAVNALWVAQHGLSADSLEQLAQLWQQLRRRDIFPARPTQVLRGLLGQSPALSTSEELGELVRLHCGIEDLRDAATSVHLVAADQLSGNAVLLSSGSPADAVRASAAIPGIFPAMWLADRWLIDGALATPAAISHAVRLGATQVYVLPAGVACALPRPPRSAVGAAVHALTLLIEQRLITEVTHPEPEATIHLLPPVCPMNVSAVDFHHGAELIQRARRASTQWIEQGGLDLPHPARFLSLHSHEQSGRAAPGLDS